MNISPKSIQGVVEGLSTAEWNVMLKKKFFFYFLKLFLTNETCLRDSALGLHAYEDRFFSYLSESALCKFT